MRPLFAVTGGLALLAGVAVAQMKETVNVHLVEVPVTVVDREGNPVRNLTAANFEIIDQGQKRQVTSFDLIDFASRQSIQSASPLNPAARRSFLLLFDLSFSSPKGRTRAQEAARNFIARGMQRRDLSAVATVDVDRGFRMLTAFTTDRNLLSAAVGNPHNFVSSDPLQIAGSTVLDGPPTDNATNQHDVNGIEENAKEVARLEKRLNDTYNRGRVERHMLILGSLAKMLRMVPGRKEVVFFSEGFDPRLVQGRDARSMGDNLEDFDLVIHGESYKTDSDARYGSSTTLNILDQMAKFFRGSDVVLNAVDIAGVRVQNDMQKGLTINSNDGLFLVSTPTGGEVFRNSNDINANIERLLHHQEVVYVLGFMAPSSTAGKFHDLKVRLKDVYTGGLRVQHRAGYWEEGAQNAIERVLTNAEIVLNDIPQADITIAALAAPFPTAKNAQVPVIVEINGADLLKDSKAATLSAEVYIYAFDEEGIVHDRMFQRLSLDPSKIGDKLRESGIKYYATLSLPEGKYAIKTLVRVPETERKGFARTDIVVPPSSDVAVLPPFFFEEPGRWLMVKGGSHDPTNAAYPFQINGEAFIPSAAVNVKNGQARQFAVFVYNAEPGEVAWEARINDSMISPALVKELRREDVTKMMFQYLPGDLKGNSGTLDFIVKKRGSAEMRKGSVAFSVK